MPARGQPAVHSEEGREGGQETGQCWVDPGETDEMTTYSEHVIHERWNNALRH